MNVSVLDCEICGNQFSINNDFGFLRRNGCICHNCAKEKRDEGEKKEKYFNSFQEKNNYRQ